jgi:cell pole-organizing protein PopZ
MSSTERAPEPTMEEILASIRRIIADDDSSPTQSNTASLTREEEATPGNIGDVEADTRIIDDIARVLSGGGQAAAGEEDILDLTKEFGPVEPPMETPVAAEPSLASQPENASRPETAETYVAATIYAASSEAGAGTGEMEPVSALEAAIAALKAGMGATSEPEPELTLTEFEMEATAPSPEAEEIVEAEQTEEAPFWPPSNASWAKNGEALTNGEVLTNGEASYDSAPAQTNGGSHEPRYAHEPHYATGEFTGQSLQDSVKASLRPLLRQWIDAHMSRVLEDALRDELKGADENLSRMLTAALRDELKDAEAKLRSN